MIEVSPKKPGSYRVKPHFSLSPRDTRRVHKELLAFGAQERLGELTMDAWLLWNYRKLVEQSQETPVEVETALHERRQWIADSEYLQEFLTEEQWQDCCFFHLNQQWNHLDYSQPGTGKTRVSIATAMIESSDAPMLILTLKACKYQWRDELLNLGYKGPIEILEGRNFKIPSRGVVITNYENLPPLSAEGKDQAPLENSLLALPKHFYLVVDEANKIQNSKANVTKRFRKLSDYVEKRGGKMIATTATPVENREAELWGMATSLRMQRKMFGNYDNFLRLFGGKMINRYGRMMVEWNPDDRIPEEIQERMSTCSRRRKRSQNRERYYEDVIVDITTNLDRFDVEGKTEDEILQMALTFENMGKIRNALAKEKLKASMDLIEALEEQGPLLVTGCTVEVIQTLGKRKGWEFIEGQVSAAKRNQIKNDFNSGKLKGVAFTVGAGGTGMNFPVAENMVVLDLHYNEGKNKQALGRNDRHDTKHERLNYYFIVANHPFQMRLHEILRRKAELAEDVLGTLD